MIACSRTSMQISLLCGTHQCDSRDLTGVLIQRKRWHKHIFLLSLRFLMNIIQEPYPFSNRTGDELSLNLQPPQHINNNPLHLTRIRTLNHRRRFLHAQKISKLRRSLSTSTSRTLSHPRQRTFSSEYTLWLTLKRSAIRLPCIIVDPVSGFSVRGKACNCSFNKPSSKSR